MKGLILKYQEKDFRFVLLSVRMNPFTNPNKYVALMFQMYEEEQLTNRTHEVILNNDDMSNFYTRWNNNSECYRELCKNIGIDPSVVPPDMDGEIIN